MPFCNGPTLYNVLPNISPVYSLLKFINGWIQSPNWLFVHWVIILNISQGTHHCASMQIIPIISLSLTQTVLTIHNNVLAKLQSDNDTLFDSTKLLTESKNI